MSKSRNSILAGARQALANARGERDGFVGHVPERIDMKAIQARPAARARPGQSD